MDTIFLTPTEIATTLKISKGLSYRLIAHGEIPSIKFGRTVRVRQEDLDAFILRNTSGLGSQGSIPASTELSRKSNLQEVPIH